MIMQQYIKLEVLLVVQNDNETKKHVYITITYFELSILIILIILLILSVLNAEGIIDLF